MTAPVQVQVPLGMICVTTWGSVTAEMAACWGNLRQTMTQQGLLPIWHWVPGALVDRARNQAVAQMLAHQPTLGWLLFIDGDAVFAPDAAQRILMTAYGDEPTADIVGGYATLRGEPYLPTIDTGTGTWESVLPGQGVMDVMRTGSAFVLIKRHCFEKVPGPWYGTRNPMRPIDALAEVDNFAHTRFDGKNPLADTPEWQALLRCALDDASSRQRHNPAQFVGEDSDFCDKARFHGLRVVVNTDVEVQHVDRTVRSAKDHRECMERREADIRRLVGVLK